MHIAHCVHWTHTCWFGERNIMHMVSDAERNHKLLLLVTFDWTLCTKCMYYTIQNMRIMHYAVQYDAKRNHSLLLLVTAGMAGGGRDAIIFSSRHHCLICHLCHHCHLCNSHHCHIHQNVAFIHIVNSIREPSTTCPRFKTVSVALSVFGVAY